MPNWCFVGLDVNVKTTEDNMEAARAQLLDYYTTGTSSEYVGDGGNQNAVFSFQGVLPFPNGEWDYKWCCKNWGTKWDMCDAGGLEQNEDSLSMFFQTAWCPPEPYFIAASNKYPLLEFKWHCDEESTAFLPYEAALLNGRITRTMINEYEMEYLFERYHEYMTSDESDDDSDSEPAAESNSEEIAVITNKTNVPLAPRTSLKLFAHKVIQGRDRTTYEFIKVQVVREKVAGDFLRAAYVDSACVAIGEDA
eukprot:SAG11_NODE_9609_length_896_cov_1.222083_1_plen_250_part_10